MGLTAKQQRIAILVEVLSKDTGKLKQLTKGLEKLKQSGESTQDAFKAVDKQQMRVKQGMAVLTKETEVGRGAMIGLGLSIMFAGMALKRFADQSLKALFKTFLDATDNTDIVTNKVHQLKAAFEFLKFSIIDSIGQTEFMLNMIDMLISATNWVSRFAAEHPRIASMAVAFLSVSSVLGALAMTGGQLSLLANALGIGLGSLVVTLGVIATAFALIFGIITSDAPKATKLFQGLLVAIGSALYLLSLIGITLSASFLMWGALALAATGLWIMMQNRMGSFKRAAQAFGIFILAMFAEIGDAAIAGLISPLEKFIGYINAAIVAIKKLGFGSNLELIRLPEYETLGDKVKKMRDRLISDVNVDKFLAGLEKEKEEAGVDKKLGGTTDTPTVVNNDITILTEGQKDPFQFAEDVKAVLANMELDVGVTKG